MNGDNQSGNSGRGRKSGAEATASGAADPRWVLCTSIWGAAILFQLLSTQWFQQNIQQGRNFKNVAAESVMLAAALGITMLPGRSALLLVLAIAQLFDCAVMAPEVPNHRLITCAVHGVLLLAALSFRAGRAKPEGVHTPFELALVPLRWVVVVLYGFAALHKLNTGFLYGPESCGAVFYLHIREVMPWIPTDTGLVSLIAPGTVVFEFALMAGLAFRRTRALMAIAGMCFHFALALDLFKHFFDFSATMTALLSLFLPREVHCEVLRIAAGRKFLVRSWRTVLLVMYTSLFVAGFFSGKPEDYYYFGRLFLWMLCAIPLIAVFLQAYVHTAAAAEEPYRFRFALPFLVPLACLLNGFLPYLGVKTRSSFDMYSNLRMEHRSSNHLFLPSLDLFGFLTDPITVVSTSSSDLQSSIVDNHLQLVRLELARFYDRHPDAQITIRWHEQEMLLTPELRREIAPELPMWLMKFLWFRPVEPGPVERCKW